MGVEEPLIWTVQKSYEVEVSHKIFTVLEVKENGNFLKIHLEGRHTINKLEDIKLTYSTDSTGTNYAEGTYDVLNPTRDFVLRSGLARFER